VDGGLAMMRALAVIAAIASAGCLRQTEFHCSATAQCSRGMCESTGYCSFDDSSCTSGRRYGDLGGPYADQCVVLDDAGVDGTNGLFSIGGTVSGLTGTGLVIQNNGMDDLPIASSGPFMFPTLLPTGTTYNITTKSPPSGQTVTLFNSQGTVGGGPVANIAVLCNAIGSDPGILCGGVYCPTGADQCCHDTSGSGGVCALAGSTCGGNQVAMTCDDSADCGGLPKICCAHLAANGTIKNAIQCVNSTSNCTANGGETAEYLCDPNAVPPCPGTMTCVLDSVRGWSRCL
jgi:hypothetical protein